MRTDHDYWREVVMNAADGCDLELTREQRESMADAMSAAHDRYGLAFYTPPSSDRMAEIEAEHKREVTRLRAEMDAYRATVQEGLKVRYEINGQGTQVDIDVHGRVLVTP